MLKAFRFTKISSFTGIVPSLSKAYDIAGIVAYVGPQESVRVRKNKSDSIREDKMRRYITVFDDTLTAIDLALWGPLCSSIADA